MIADLRLGRRRDERVIAELGLAVRRARDFRYKAWSAGGERVIADLGSAGEEKNCVVKLVCRKIVIAGLRSAGRWRVSDCRFKGSRALVE